MKQSKKEIKLNYNAIDLYNIVLNIEEYPIYIPWCSKIEIIKKKRNMIKARMHVNYKIKQTQKFTSEVIFYPNKNIIETNYVDGPLKDLFTKWEFLQLKNKNSKVIFTVGFEFKNFMHQKLAELFLPLIEDKMMKSFVKRANNILD